MPRGPELPRVHRLDITDDQSRLLGLMWDKFIAEMDADIPNAMAIAQTLINHVNVIGQEHIDDPDYIPEMLFDLKNKFDTLWKLHGCNCGNPNCSNNRDNPDGDPLGGLGGDTIIFH